MAENVSYCDEKIGAVIHGILTSMQPLSLQERVNWAAQGTGTLNPEDFPADLREDFQKFRRRVTAVVGGPEGSFKASSDALTDHDAHEVMVSFVTLAFRVADRV